MPGDKGLPFENWPLRAVQRWLQGESSKSESDVFAQLRDLELALNELTDEERRWQDLALVKLEQVRVRRAPLRVCQRSAVLGVARLRFGDGTCFLARAVHQPLSLAATALAHGHRLLLTEIDPTEQGIRIELAWTERRLLALIIGFDQPD